MSRFANGLAAAAFLVSSNALAAACCGGGVLAPQIVSGDFRAQVSSTLSLTHLTFNGAWAVPRILDDRLQLSARMPLALFTPGDLAVGANLELLRGWESSGALAGTDVLAFVGLQMPTGVSIYELRSLQSQVSGTGFFRVSGGVFAARVWGDVDLQVLAALHRDLSRRFMDGSGDPIFVDPGFGAITTLGVGWSPSAGFLRFGLQTTVYWEQGIVTLQPGQAARGRDAASLDLSANLAWLIDSTWTLSAAYTEPLGTESRDRSAALLLQKRWWR